MGGLDNDLEDILEEERKRTLVEHHSRWCSMHGLVEETILAKVRRDILLTYCFMRCCLRKSANDS